jgi:hypothetical protein
MPDIAMQDCSTVQAVPYPYVDFDFAFKLKASTSSTAHIASFGHGAMPL